MLPKGFFLGAAYVLAFALWTVLCARTWYEGRQLRRARRHLMTVNGHEHVAKPSE